MLEKEETGWGERGNPSTGTLTIAKQMIIYPVRGPIRSWHEKADCFETDCLHLPLPPYRRRADV